MYVTAIVRLISLAFTIAITIFINKDEQVPLDNL